MAHAILVFALTLFIAATLIHGSVENDQRKPYIVYMGDLPEVGVDAVDVHHKMLMRTFVDELMARTHKIHSYGKSFNGFVANLFPDEAKRLSEEDGVVSVFENTMRKLHTTRSWDFLGMPQASNLRRPKIESNIIIALLDTGIWVDSPSFNDEGFGPPPPHWKGKCEKGANFTGCNNKVIGARYYSIDRHDSKDKTPVDTEGHGTHTSATAAGISIHGSSLYGIAEGTARGGAPSARIAMYKVCGFDGCSDMDILAGFDDAIHDGIDFISVSIGGASQDFFKDPIALGSFHAMKKGILTSCSAGNNGPDVFTVENVAPWILTVGASSIDRDFRTDVVLGNGRKFTGDGINTFSPGKKMQPLTSGTLSGAETNITFGDKSDCDYETLNPKKVKGKILYCQKDNQQDYTIKELGGIGTIMSSDEKSDVDFITYLPALVIDVNDGVKIDRYINSTRGATAMVHRTRAVKMDSAPFVASFSARGPQLMNLNILKPDVVAPGLNILAAYSALASLTGTSADTRYPGYNIISGTSMACPHATGAAAYVKSFHPDWSPAAVKSALMTTATQLKVEDKLGAGSGQINPAKAVDPGLIFDLPFSSYLRFLCKEGYNSKTLHRLIGGKSNQTCSSFRPAEGTDGLNYPTMHHQLNRTETRFSAEFYRVVTNVGSVTALYKAEVTGPKGLAIEVFPRSLSFRRLNEKKTFKVTVKGTATTRRLLVSGALVWRDGKHSVTSPIVIYKDYVA